MWEKNVLVLTVSISKYAGKAPITTPRQSKDNIKIKCASTL
jgi:hypothetical protein